MLNGSTRSAKASGNPQDRSENRRDHHCRLPEAELVNTIRSSGLGSFCSG